MTTYKVAYNGDEDMEIVLEKALSKIKKDRESTGYLRDDYLRSLQKYSNKLYKAITDKMIDDIINILYGEEKPIEKSQNKVLVRFKR